MATDQEQVAGPALSEPRPVCTSQVAWQKFHGSLDRANPGALIIVLLLQTAAHWHLVRDNEENLGTVSM